MDATTFIAEWGEVILGITASLIFIAVTYEAFVWLFAFVFLGPIFSWMEKMGQ
jgi:hypothetical protein|tara:strand:- start:30 stop:188 length:159 start_codon:yes stop_codon:yes gene_type:complete